MNSSRIIFFGTPEFSIPSLDILLKSGYGIPAVITVPDKPKGRGQQVSSSPVKEFAKEKGLRVFQPESLRDPKFIGKISDLMPDLGIVVAYKILPPELFMIPRYGSINLHASLLPKYRGAAPINWALINGEEKTGVTTFFLKKTVDTGNIILQDECVIGEYDTAGDLSEKLSHIGAVLLLETVRLIEKRVGKTTPQDEALATNAPKLTKELGIIDWKKNARDIHNLIRGLSPEPCAYTYYGSTLIKFYRSRVISESTQGEPGKIVTIKDSLQVATGQGVIEILELQREGKKRLAAEEFLRSGMLESGGSFKSV